MVDTASANSPQSSSLNGSFKAIQGNVVVQHANGDKVFAKVGMVVSEGDRIASVGSSAAVLIFQGDSTLSVGHDQVINIDQKLAALLNDLMPEESVANGVNFDAIVNAIEEGQNLEELLPATAAGDNQVAGSSTSSGAQGVRIDSLNREVTPESGFDTTASTTNAAFNNDAGIGNSDFVSFNSPPQTSGIDDIAVVQDGSVVIDVAAAFTDADGDQTLTFQVSGLPDGLVFDAATGLVTGSPTNTAAISGEGSYRVDVTATDSSGAEDGVVATSFSIQVQNLNDVPEIVAAPVLGDVIEDHSLTFTADQLLAGAVDIDGDALTVSNLRVSVGQGSVLENNDGTYTFTPEQNWSGLLQLSYDIADGQGASVEQSAVFQVSAENDAPEAHDDGSFDVRVNQSIVVDLLSNDIDVDGDILTITAIDAEHGSVTIGELGVVIYTPDSDYVGADTLAYTVIDGNGGSSEASAAISVFYNPVMLSIDTLGVVADATPTFTGTSVNVDGDITLTVNGTSYAVTPNDDGSWRFELPDNDLLIDGTYTVDVSAGDPVLGAILSSDRFDVDSGQPSAPTLSLDSDSGQDSSDSITNDGAYSVVGVESGATVEYSTDGTTWSTTAPLAMEGANSIQVRQTDVAGNVSASSTLAFTLDTSAPVGSLTDQNLLEDFAQYTIDLAAVFNDAISADSHLVFAVTGNTNINVSVNSSGLATVTSTADWSGTEIIRFSATDEAGNSADIDVNFVVSPVNDPAVVTSADVVLSETDSPLTTSGTLTSSDVDNDDNTFTAATVVGVTGTFSITEAGAWLFTANDSFDSMNEGDAVNETFNVTTIDGTSTTVEITINGTNDAPIVSAETFSMGVSDVLVGNILKDGVIDVDVDVREGDVYSTNLTLNFDASTYSNGDSTWVSTAPASNTTYSFALGSSASDDSSISSDFIGISHAINFDGTNNAGTSSSFQNLTGNPSDNSASFEIWFKADADSDHDVLFESGASGDGVSIRLNGSVVEFFVKDGTANAQLSFDLTDIGIDPSTEFVQLVGVISDQDTVELYVNGSLADSVSSPLISDWAGGDSTGLGQVNGGVNFNSPGNFEGDISIFRFYESALSGDQVLSNFRSVAGMAITEIDGSSFTLETPISLAHGDLTISADGSYRFEPDAGYDGSQSFSYTLTDTAGSSSTETITIAVDGNGPNAQSDSASVLEGGSVSIDVVGNDSDTYSDVDATSVAIVAGPAHGSVTVNADGSVDYQNDGNEYTSDSFSYTVADEFGNVSNTATVNISITPQNDAPVASDINLLATENGADISVNLNSYVFDAENNSISFSYDSLPTGVSADANGVLSFDVDNLAYAHLAAGQTQDITVSYTANDNNGGTDSGLMTITVTGVNDSPTVTTALISNVTEDDSTYTLDLLSNASDADDGDVLSVANLTLLSGDDSGITINGDGTLTVNPDVYTQLASGTTETLTYSFDVIDSDGASVSTSATITITGQNDGPVAVDDINVASVQGQLFAEYYGYQEGTDGSNLSNISQLETFISSNDPEAYFIATDLNYNAISGDLATGTSLQTFLGDDAASLTSDPIDASDAIIRIVGQIELSAGEYNFRVRADDGYTIRIDGVDVATSNFNQAPTTTTHASFTVSSGVDGDLHDIEILYWDQAGQAVFQAELSGDGGASYDYVNSDTYPITGNYELAVQSGVDLDIDSSVLLSNDSDVDGDTLTVSAVGNASLGGVVVLNADGSITYTAPSGYTGPATFDYTISDGQQTDTATVTINVVDDPTAVDDVAVVETNESTSGNMISGAGGQTDGTDYVFNGSGRISQIEFNGTTYSSFDSNGELTVAGNYGDLVISRYGTYTYTSNVGTVTLGGGNASSWSGATYYGYIDGQSFTDGDGHLDLSLANAGASDFYLANGIGLDSNVTNDSDEIDLAGAEALVIELDGSANSVDISLRQTNGTDAATWTAYNANFEEVGTGVTANNPNDIQLSVANADMTGDFMYLVFTAGDSDDAYRVDQISYQPLYFTGSEVFTYTVENATGDTDVASLTVNHSKFVGDAGENAIVGADNNDILYGLDGNDILIGGAGNDILYGADATQADFDTDVFVWREGDDGTITEVASDSVYLFESGLGGDVLDLSDLLQGEESGDINDYLQITFGDFDGNGDTTDTKLSIDVDSSSGVSQEIVLVDTDLSVGYTIDPVQALQNLLDDGNLNVD